MKEELNGNGSPEKQTCKATTRKNRTLEKAFVSAKICPHPEGKKKSSIAAIRSSSWPSSRMKRGCPMDSDGKRG
jgi:hypothetical protein